MIAVVRSLLGHVIDQHHRFLQARQSTPSHLREARCHCTHGRYGTCSAWCVLLSTGSALHDTRGKV